MRREWTKKEEEYLIKKYLNQPTAKTAERLGRSVTSVKRKASKLGLNHYLDNINAKTIAKCFHSDVSVVIRWIEKFDLPARRIECNNQTRYSIDPLDFWKWADKNRALINWSRYEVDSFPPEPAWAKEEVKNYRAFRSRKRFTHSEKEYIYYLFKKGLTCEEVAIRTGRSLYSIRHVSKNQIKESKTVR